MQIQSSDWLTVREGMFIYYHFQNYCMIEIKKSCNLPSFPRSALNRVAVKERYRRHESSEKRLASAFNITKSANRYLPGTDVIGSSYEVLSLPTDNQRALSNHPISPP